VQTAGGYRAFLAFLTQAARLFASFFFLAGESLIAAVADKFLSANGLK